MFSQYLQEDDREGDFIRILCYDEIRCGREVSRSERCFSRI